MPYRMRKSAELRDMVPCCSLYGANSGLRALIFCTDLGDEVLGLGIVSKLHSAPQATMSRHPPDIYDDMFARPLPGLQYGC